jgi:hypothetical protein
MLSPLPGSILLSIHSQPRAFMTRSIVCWAGICRLTTMYLASFTLAASSAKLCVSIRPHGSSREML